MIVALDIDNIVCDPISSLVDMEAVKNCKPTKEAVEALRYIKEHGHEIIIFTRRDPSLCLETETWLQQNDIPYDYVILGKPKYDVLIDTKCYKYDNWDSFIKKYRERIESK